MNAVPYLKDHNDKMKPRHKSNCNIVTRRYKRLPHFNTRSSLHYAARAMGGVTLRQKKREELESKSSHKSDIWPPAASKK